VKRLRLVDRIRGVKAETASGTVEHKAYPTASQAYDGTLDGQPPTAPLGNWGDLSWLRRR